MAKSAEAKMVLSASNLGEVRKALASDAAEEQMPDQRPRANLVGMAAGVKWKNGKPTGEPALLFLVTQKIEKGQLASGDMLPAKVADMQTDVMAVGYPTAGDEPAAGAETLTKRVRPAQGGWSVGHFAITAGTIGTGVYEILPGGAVSPPVHGVGVPPQYFILSNNHVLANTNNATVGDAIWQPGPADGGSSSDRIGKLTRFVPMTLAPQTPVAEHHNLVDAAIAEVEFHDLDRRIYWIGAARGWRRKADVTVGTLVKKTGRTTSFTAGRITAVDATIDVGYSGGRTGRFVDQILLTRMSAGGDSGSLILTLDDVAVGLLFAGSSVATIANQIENVRALLRVEVAEQIL